MKEDAEEDHHVTIRHTTTTILDITGYGTTGYRNPPTDPPEVSTTADPNKDLGCFSHGYLLI